MTLEFGKKSDLSELKRNSDRCPECRKGSITEDEHTGERVCMDCGVVLQENLESKQLPMIPHSTPMASSSSILELYSKDSSGKQVPVAVRQSFQRLSRFNIASDSSKVAREKRVNAILEGLCDKLGLPEQVNSGVLDLLRDTKHLVKSRSPELRVAAAVYLTCRSMGIPKKLTEVARLADVELTALSKTYRVFHRRISENLTEDLRKKYLDMPSQDPVIYVGQIASKSGILESISRVAIKLIHDNSKNLTGSDPSSLATTALYIACRLYSSSYRTQKSLAAEAGITEVTIRNNLKKFKIVPGKKLLI